MNNATLINQDSGIVEYGTPGYIIDRARGVMGGINLDPASDEIFNKAIKADLFYDKKIDGLTREWHGSVWMNHPFGRGELACVANKKCFKKRCDPTLSQINQPANWRGHCVYHDTPGNADWINKLVSEYERGHTRTACCVTYAATSETWFRPLLSFPQCFLHGRTSYVGVDGRPVFGNTKGSVVTYLGKNVRTFVDWFRDIGTIKIAYGELP